MCYRYIFILVRLFSEFLLGRKSRSLGGLSWKDNLWFFGRTAGILFIRSLKLAEEVYLAMTSKRGFDGEVRLPSKRTLRVIDYGWIFFVFILLGALTWKG